MKSNQLVYKSMLLGVFFVLFFSGCSSKELKTQYIYKDVYIPTKCNVKMPKKPKDGESFEAHKLKMIYLFECEELLKSCIGDKNENK